MEKSIECDFKMLRAIGRNRPLRWPCELQQPQELVANTADLESIPSSETLGEGFCVFKCMTNHGVIDLSPLRNHLEDLRC